MYRARARDAPLRDYTERGNADGEAAGVPPPGGYRLFDRAVTTSFTITESLGSSPKTT